MSSHRHHVDFICMHPGGIPASEHFFSLVREHPELTMPAHETHYFSDPERLSRGPDWYEAQFPRTAPPVRRGELSTTYLAAPAAASAIAAQYPDARVMALIVNPLEMVHTHYERSQTKPDATALPVKPTVHLEQWLEEHPLTLPQCQCVRGLSQFFVYYSPVDLFVLTLDDVRANPSLAIKRLYARLDVTPTFIPKVLQVLEEDEKKPGFWVRTLRLDRVRQHRRERRLARAKNQFPSPHLSFSERERILLAHYFNDEVIELSALLNRDLRAEWGWPTLP